MKKNCKATENSQLKCGDYSILFSMCADDIEQHFKCQCWFTIVAVTNKKKQQ